ncbi:hypothetical protein NQ315_001236 [Exocentrus adspersus]|uniref:P21-activated protein kinase-interacting protein 1-like n=1 Tax=Exocentrus adspersus TaxID=1586481 RepID=A0AAV8WFZ1_9CUCU|nr:hypothetical protein NQ315_001236 [Exocentrus adspersus]
MKTPKFEIIAGTYEQFLLGFPFVSKQAELVQSFAVHGHSSSIRCVATSDKYLASGGADDRIIVYDLNTRKEHCILNQHEATINCLQFTSDSSHLLSGSSDGELCIVRAGSWQLEKKWAKAHQGASILDIAVHPSGKLALTLGSDRSLRTWNLIKGRQAYIINLNSKSKDAKSLERIIWAEDGVRFILAGGKYTEIWSIETGGLLQAIEHHEKVTSCLWMSEDVLLVGYEDGQIASVNINESSKELRKAHEARVKALGKYSKWIVSASSNGEIKVWNKRLNELAKHETECRITCFAIVSSNLKIKEEADEDALEAADELAEKEPVRKSTVIVEVENSDEEVSFGNVVKSESSGDGLKGKRKKKKRKAGSNEVETGSKDSKVKRDKKRKRSSV